MPEIEPQAREKESASRVLPFAIVALVAAYALTHPFTGFTGDAQIYMGRALADNDPAGVGRDLMYRLDGQSRFSLFPPIAAWLAARMSLIAAAQCLVVASSLLWLASAIALARAAAPQRALAVAAVIVLAPTAYGGFNLLRYAEQLAEPRPFAEAFVLFALATFLAERRLIAVACLIAAALFHPIMALAGVAALGVCLCVEDRRWLIAAVAGAVACIIATRAGAPLFDRLRVVIDPEWRDLLASRNAYLFPNLWPADAWALPLVQTITILTAARHAAPPLRRLMFATLAAGAFGLAVAYVVGAFDSVLLLMQAQFWRMWWLAAVVAALALGLRATEPQATTGPRGLALAMLALSWAFAQEAGLYAPLLACASLYVDRSPSPKIADEISRALWLGCGVAVVAHGAVDLPSAKMFAGLVQPGYTPSIMPLTLKFIASPLLFGAVALAAFGASSRIRNLRTVAIAAPSVALALAAGLLWNDASSFDRHMGAASRQADLAALMPDQKGEVLWLYSSFEPWVWLGRPGWSADMQGAGAVFSRELALTYRDRAHAQIDAGLRDETMIRRVPYRPKTFHPALTETGVAAICRRADAPAYIVAPVTSDAALDPALKARFWTPPAARVEILFRDDGVAFPRLDRYAIMDCAEHR